MTIVKRALVSVSNKSGIVDFCKGLSKLGIEILSTGGPAKLLAENKTIPFYIIIISILSFLVSIRSIKLLPVAHRSVKRTKET